MTWIKFSERKPERPGTYPIVKLNKGSPSTGFFNAIPPSHSIRYMEWKETLKFKSQSSSDVIYEKIKLFIDEHEIRQNEDEIIFWYELDPIPEEQ